MPVFKCSDDKFRIGTGKCIYDSKEKADKAFQGFRKTVRESFDKASLNEEEPNVTLTDKELQAMLDARIRRDASYHFGNNAMMQFDSAKVARKVYDSIISSFEWNPNTVKATRAVKFSVNYVKKIIKAAEEDGSLLAESIALDALAESIAEGLNLVRTDKKSN